MKIQVLGSGCATCQSLHKAVEAVVANLNLGLSVEYSTDVVKIIELGAMSIPVFAINDKVIVAGKVPNVEEIEQAILAELKNANHCCKDKDKDHRGSGCCKNNNQEKPKGSCSCGGNC